MTYHSVYRATAAESAWATHHQHNPDAVVSEFKVRFYDTERFFDRFAKGKFARPLFDRHEQGPGKLDADNIRILLEETALFIDACYAFEIWPHRYPAPDNPPSECPR